MNLPSARRTFQVIAMAAGLGAVSISSGAIDPNSTCEAIDSSYYAWSPPVAETMAGAPSAPAPDTLLGRKGNSSSYVAQGDTLFAIRNVADKKGPAGSISWTWQAALPTALVSAPVPVLPSQGKEVIFLTTADGFLHKINADYGTTTASVDTRRRIDGSLICQNAPEDGIFASPAVQIYDLADDAFRSTLNAMNRRHDDLVFVVTANGCGDRTRNRIIAYWASDLTVAWTFNADGAVKVDLGAACIVDYATNTIFCGTDLADDATGQCSLFALDTATGQMKWSHNAGPILNRPLLVGGRLYVASKVGVVQAYDPLGNGLGGGLALWSTSLAVASPGSIIASNPAPYVLGSQISLLIVDSSGILHLIRDQGSSGAVAWDLAAGDGVWFTSAPVGAPLLNKAYVGRDDGRIQQIEVDMIAGVSQGVVTVNVDANVGDPSLDADPGSSALNRLVVAGEAGKVTRLNLPLCLQPPY